VRQAGVRGGEQRGEMKLGGGFENNRRFHITFQVLFFSIADITHNYRPICTKYAFNDNSLIMTRTCVDGA